MSSDIGVLKTESQQLVTRISIQAKNRSLKIAAKLISIIRQTKSISVVTKIKQELNDILMHVDLEIIECPDDYFHAMIQYYSRKP